MGRTGPLVVHLLLPLVLGQHGHGVFPLSTDPHAFVQLEANVGEGRLPHIMVFEFFFNAEPERLRDHGEGVSHALLRIRGEDIGVSPDSVETAFNHTHKTSDGAKGSVLKVLEVFADRLEVSSNNFRGHPHLFVFLRPDVLVLKLGPCLDLVSGSQHSSELVGRKCELLQVCPSFPDGAVEARSEGVEQISKLVVLIAGVVFVALPEPRHVYLGNQRVKRRDSVFLDG